RSCCLFFCCRLWFPRLAWFLAALLFLSWLCPAPWPLNWPDPPCPSWRWMLAEFGCWAAVGRRVALPFWRAFWPDHFILSLPALRSPLNLFWSLVLSMLVRS